MANPKFWDWGKFKNNLQTIENLTKDNHKIKMFIFRIIIGIIIFSIKY